MLVLFGSKVAARLQIFSRRRNLLLHAQCLSAVEKRTRLNALFGLQMSSNLLKGFPKAANRTAR